MVEKKDFYIVRPTKEQAIALIDLHEEIGASFEIQNEIYTDKEDFDEFVRDAVTKSTTTHQTKKFRADTELLEALFRETTRIKQEDLLRICTYTI